MLSIKSSTRGQLSLQELKRHVSARKLVEIYDPFTLPSRPVLRKRYKRIKIAR